MLRKLLSFFVCFCLIFQIVCSSFVYANETSDPGIKAEITNTETQIIEIFSPEENIGELNIEVPDTPLTTEIIEISSESSGGTISENQNQALSEENTFSGAIQDNTGSIDTTGSQNIGTSSGNSEPFILSGTTLPIESPVTLSGGILPLFQIKIDLQQPSYVTLSGSSLYVCDDSKPECKVNFDLRKTFSGAFLEKDFKCSIDFGFTGALSESQKCNPNTLTFPLGKTKILLRIEKKSGESLILQKNIEVWNRVPPDVIGIEDENETNFSSSSGTIEENGNYSGSGENISLNSSSGTIENTGSLVNSEVGENITLRHQLQIPSYVDITSSGNLICDASKESCKINFSFLPTFTGGLLEKDYVCKIDFGLGTPTGEEEKCNPNTVIFPYGTHILTLSLFSKINGVKKAEKTYIIENLVQEFEKENESSISENLSQTGQLQIPEIRWELQRPSYVEEETTESGTLFICDPRQKECKINFSFLPTFTGSFLEKDYICKINFGLGNSTGEEEKCNPNTLTFPQGMTEISFTLFSKKELNILKEKRFFVQNAGYNPSSSLLTPPDKISFFPLGVQVQSGLEGDGRYLYCKKKDCTINLEYKTHHEDERCFWDFGVGIASSESTHTRCNPGLVKFPEGVHELSLRVYQKDYETNNKIYRFYIYNETLIPGEKEEIIPDQENNFFSGSGEFSLELQGKLGKGKIRDGNLLQCSGVKKCYVNLKLNAENISGDYRVIWYLDGNEISQKANPSGIWVDEGNHYFEVKVLQEENVVFTDTFDVAVSSDLKTLMSQKIPLESENKVGTGIILGDILPNAPGNDFKEFIEVRNISDEAKNLLSCSISDSSRSYIFPELILGPHESYYLFPKISGISLGNSKDTIVLMCGDTIFGEISYDAAKQENELLSGKFLSPWEYQDIEKNVPESIFSEYLNFTTKLSFTILKREGVKIYGNTLPNTELGIFQDSQKYFSLQSDSSGKFLLKTKNILAGDYLFSIQLKTPDGTWRELREVSFSLSQNERNFWFQTTKKSIKTKKTLHTPMKLLLSKDTALPGNMVPSKVPLYQKMLFFFFIILSFLILGSHGIYIYLKNLSLSELHIVSYLLVFRTRQKCLLLGV